ncbi:MAG: ribonucleotide reductase subunit alpha [Gallionella sp.]|nr:ribonucleotide reductase subunit alpha [Gallionella sp.]
MNISSYEDLLNAANAQSKPQRMLFVFTRAELPGEHTKDQQDEFKARKGGALMPVMCVDKLASARGSFSSLVEESSHTGKDWDIVFVACMTGKSADATDSDEAEEPLKEMVKSIQVGSIGNYLAFNRAGEMVRLKAS